MDVFIFIALAVGVLSLIRLISYGIYLKKNHNNPGFVMAMVTAMLLIATPTFAIWLYFSKISII